MKRITKLPRRCYTCKYYDRSSLMCFAPYKVKHVINDDEEVEMVLEPNPITLFLKAALLSTTPTIPIASCELWKPKVKA